MGRGGGGVAQRSTLRANEPKMTGARSAAKIHYLGIFIKKDKLSKYNLKKVGKNFYKKTERGELGSHR